MFREGFQNILDSASLSPRFAILILVFAFNPLAHGLLDAVDQAQRRRM
jgi:ABC-type dipeptide/oligopeptide/nickel transport system permease subunit